MDVVLDPHELPLQQRWLYDVTEPHFGLHFHFTVIAHLFVRFQTLG